MGITAINPERGDVNRIVDVLCWGRSYLMPRPNSEVLHGGACCRHV